MCNCAEWRRGSLSRGIRTACIRDTHCFLRDHRGITALEFALMLPVLLLIVFGTFEFGRAFKARNEMSHALSKAVRVVNLDVEKTPEALAEQLSTDLGHYDADELSIDVARMTISGTEYMHIAVNFPFDVIIPLSSVTTITLGVDTRAPVLSPTQ